MGDEIESGGCVRFVWVTKPAFLVNNVHTSLLYKAILFVLKYISVLR